MLDKISTAWPTGQKGPMRNYCVQFQK